MMQRIAKVQLRLMKYGAFIGILGGIASFVGEPHNGLLKSMIGVIIGCMILGKRLPSALIGAFEAAGEFTDEIEDKFQN